MGPGAHPVILPVTAPRNRARQYLQIIRFLIPDFSDEQYPTNWIPNSWLIRYLIPNTPDNQYQTYQIPNTQLNRYLIPNFYSGMSTNFKVAKLRICKWEYCGYANENFADPLRKMIFLRITFFFPYIYDIKVYLL